MSKIIYIPLEHIDGRYTVHMDRDIEKYLNIETQKNKSNRCLSIELKLR